MTKEVNLFHFLNHRSECIANCSYTPRGIIRQCLYDAIADSKTPANAQIAIANEHDILQYSSCFGMRLLPRNKR